MFYSVRVTDKFMKAVVKGQYHDLSNIYWDGNLKITEYFHPDGRKLSTMEELYRNDEVIYRRIYDNDKEEFIYERYFDKL